MAAMADPWDQLSVMSSSCQKSSESLMLRHLLVTGACTNSVINIFIGRVAAWSAAAAPRRFVCVNVQGNDGQVCAV